MCRIYLNDGWSYTGAFTDDLIDPEYSGPLEKVRIPHSVCMTPFNCFDEHCYQKLSGYRRELVTDQSWEGKRVLLTFEGIAHDSEVFVNGTSAATHHCGYTAFTTDITPYLLPAGRTNIIAVKDDSRETLDIPPFGYVIDYMTYGGIYRDVYIEVKNSIFISDIYVHTRGTDFFSAITLSDSCPAGYTVRQRITGAGGTEYAELHADVHQASACTEKDSIKDIRLWDTDKPVLYSVQTELLDENGACADSILTRFGFRDIRFDSSGFFLNGKKLKLRGLNRHQSWPYAGYAMPARMQRKDADILKFELGLNEVRTSHYPQSRHFIDRCDEIGLLVFTEIPGWQHIGDSEWKDQAVRNVQDMVMQYRNHPSVFMWGVRINESGDDDALYTRTNAAAHALDPFRPTSGVRFIRHSHLLEDVYSYNDFSHTGGNHGTVRKRCVTDTKKGYMISEYGGHMFPTKSFDDEKHRTEHALRHANVLDAVAADEEIAGASGWCAFDYNTHKDFGSGDRICYHGVMDMYRNPKLAAAVYRSQQDAETAGDVLVVSSSMDIGEYPAGVRTPAWIFTNADSVRMYINGSLIKEYRKEASPYTHLRHGPLLIDDYIGDRLEKEEHYSAGTAASLRKVLGALQIYGEQALPLKDKIAAASLMLRGISRIELTRLYGKYIGNWGGASVTYTFEAYRGGRRVKTVSIGASTEACIRAEPDSIELTEENGYDATGVRMTAIDQHGNILPYYQEAVALRTEGPVEILGPSAVSLKGGMGGTYIRTTGKAGDASLCITDCSGRTQTIHFSVKIRE